MLQAFGINANVPGVRMDETIQTGLGYAWCEIFPEGKPSSIQVQVGLDKEQDGVTPFVMYMGQDHDVPFAFQAPVEWSGDSPNTRLRNTEGKGFDNADVILLDTTAHFDDVQVSVVIRDRRFILMLHEVFEGAVRIVDGEPVYIPAKAHYNYPRNNYGATWDKMGSMVARLTQVIQATTQAFGGELEMPVAPEWKPAPIKQVHGKVSATMAYHNPVTGSGMAVGDDGEEFQIFDRNLRGVKGTVKIIEPMSRVLLEPGQRAAGHSRTPVKSCLPYIFEEPKDQRFKGR